MKLPRISRFPSIIIAALALGLVGGCVQTKAPTPATKLPDSVLMMIGPGAKLVKQGKPPLQFKADREGNLSVVDMTAGQLNSFASIRVAGSVLIIDPKENGIRIRNPKQPQVREMLAGTAPIDPEHVYGIYYTPSR
jgi:hypothetical protein